MSTAQGVLNDLSESISEMVEMARRVKGEQFITVVSAIFECMQVEAAVGRIGAHVAAAGVDIAAPTQTVRFVATSAAARIASLLSDSDGDEAVLLARRMLERRDRTERDLAGAAQRSGG